MKKIIFGVLGIIALLMVLQFAFGIFGDFLRTTKDEFGPKAALQKYEWFVDQSNRIDKAYTDIQLFEMRTAAVDSQYISYGPMNTWPPDIRVQYNRAKQTSREDCVAVISNYNNLIRDYNAASSKFNWAPFRTRPDFPRQSYDEYVLPAL